VHWLRCVLAEWQLVRARLVRSRLGIWLLLLGAGGAWLAARGASLTVLAPQIAMLGAVLGVAFTVGSDADRAAIALTLTHPTTPLAVATGRWLAAVTAAGIVVLALLFVAGAQSSLPAGAVVRAAVAGFGAAAGAAGCALLVVARGGNALAGALLLYIAVPSVLSADALRVAQQPGAVTWIGIAILELLPGGWRYDALATGDPAGWAHATAWAAGGVVLAARLLARRAR